MFLSSKQTNIVWKEFCVRLFLLFFTAFSQDSVTYFDNKVVFLTMKMYKMFLFRSMPLSIDLGRSRFRQRYSVQYFYLSYAIFWLIAEPYWKTTSERCCSVDHRPFYPARLVSQLFLLLICNTRRKMRVVTVLFFRIWSIKQLI